MSTCKQCRSSIDSNATICPYCRSEQPQITGGTIIIAIVAILLISFFSSDNELEIKEQKIQSEHIIAVPKPPKEKVDKNLTNCIPNSTSRTDTEITIIDKIETTTITEYSGTCINTTVTRRTLP